MSSRDEPSLAAVDELQVPSIEDAATAPQCIARPKDLVLTFLSGSLEGQMFEFWGPRRVLIGRSKECDIELFDGRASRHHCSLQFDGERVQVKDLGSANGTRLNGRTVKLANAESGDVLRLGDSQLRIELADADRTLKLKRVEFAPEADTGRIVRDPSLRVEIPGFQLAGVLGQGATSAVFKARRLDDGAIVAIKVLKVGASVSPEDRERFLREAETAGDLVHPNIVRVLGHGAADQALYIVMEFVRGETARERLKRLGKLPVPVALHVARQIASALEHARTRNIVHRDVKPENILIQEDGVAKLVDFGLAKSVLTAGISGLTRVGDVLGTLAYMAPEQLECSVNADHRSDLYSLGATLFHLIAGTTPFSARTNIEYFNKILNEAPPELGLLRRDVPPIVSAMVGRCMRKNPAERYQTADEIVRLASCLLSSGEQQTTAF